jgi:hypothetical protein
MARPGSKKHSMRRRKKADRPVLEADRSSLISSPKAPIRKEEADMSRAERAETWVILFIVLILVLGILIL